MVKMVNFMLYIFNHNLKKKITKHLYFILLSFLLFLPPFVVEYLQV